MMNDKLQEGIRLLKHLSIVLLCSGGVVLLLKLLAHSKGDDQGFVMILVGLLGLLVYNILTLITQRIDELGKDSDQENSANKSSDPT